MSNTTEKLLSCKELASQLSRSQSYVSAMKRKGFKMTGNRATLSEARRFLSRVQHPRAKAREATQTADK